MTQKKLTQTLTDTLTHTIKHLPSIEIGFLHRFGFFLPSWMRLFVAHISFFTSELVKSCWSWSEILVSVLSYCGHSIYSHTQTHIHTWSNTFRHWSSIQKFDRCSDCGNATHLHFSIFFESFLKHFYARSKGWWEGAESLFACWFVYIYFGICSLSVGLFIYFK